MLSSASSTPQLTIRTELDKGKIEDHLTWAEIVFGNCPVDWAKRAPQLKWLQIVSTGIDTYLDLASKPLIVTCAKGVHSKAIAQHISMMMLVFTRNFQRHQQEQRNKIWNRDPDSITTLAGKRLGIVGLGGIGEHLIPFASWSGMEVVGIKKRSTSKYPNLQVWGMDRLNELLRTSDHIVLALPYTPETVELLNEHRINQIKPGAFLYNVSRGELINEQALIRALQTKKLGGAALDVFEKEPLAKNHPMWEITNLIITPHIAGHFNGLRENTFELFKVNMSLFLQRLPLKNQVDFTQGY